MVRLDSSKTHNGVGIHIHKKLNYTSTQTEYGGSLQNITIRLKYYNKNYV